MAPGKRDRQPPEDGGWDNAHDSNVATETEKKVKRPQLYKVLLHNDDYTTMEFVVHVLSSVFHHPESEAVAIMLQVHKKGVGVAGIFSYEIAEAKANKVMRLAREHEFPLRCSVEADE
jgi:ATP-dependent Clp protease adaptor protein ClpS